MRKSKSFNDISQLLFDQAVLREGAKLNNPTEFVERLNKLNTDKTKPLSSIINASLKLRKDEVKDGKIRDQILKNSPENNEEYFVVPKVIE